ncbi:MAG TPA: L-lactate dehydrogenase [Vicinamibacteria bacterium]
MKIGIVGAGLVGATAAYALVMRGLGRQLVLVDRNEARARAEADDILHAVPFAHPVDVVAGGYPDLAGASLVILTAGVGQRPGETRLQLLARNAAVFGEIVPAVLDHAPGAVLVVATNPVDVMTHLAARFAAARGVTSSRVLGSGTTLDTARFRALLGRRLGVDAAHVHAYVVGEHGDSEVLTWSIATVGGLPLADMAERHGVAFDDGARKEIDAAVRGAADAIIAGKGATYYGVGSALARIVDAVLRDQRSVLTVSTPQADVAGVAEVTVSLPRLVGGAGVIETLPLTLAPDEEALLARSARIVREAIGSLDAATP